MSTAHITEFVESQDREFYERELTSFIPDRIFDAHSHVWHSDHVEMQSYFPKDVDYDDYVRLMQDIHPGRTTKALFIPLSREREMDQAANEWTGQVAAQDPQCRGAYYFGPEHDPEWLRQEMRRLGLTGLKCYHVRCNVEPTFSAQLPDYMPEPFFKLAHEEGWTVTLHMVRDRACADEGNIHWIRHFCERYPNMKLILAHSARAFQPGHALEGLPQLTGLDNLWCDTSANCESIAHQAIIRILGHKRLLYGTDLPASHTRGRSAATADSFVWMYADTPVWKERHTTIKPVLTGLEHLRSLKWACWSERLSDSAVEDIFWNNAVEAFGLE